MQWQFTRDHVRKAEVNRPQRSVSRLLNEWKNDQWSVTIESLDSEDQSLWRFTRRVMRVLIRLHTLVTPMGSLSDTLKKPKPLQTIWKLSFNW